MHLYRIDNRLVHGQIISTWMPHLRLKRFVVINDNLPKNALRMKMFRMAIPLAVEFSAMTIEQAGKTLNASLQSDVPTIVLLESIDDAVRLFESSLYEPQHWEYSPWTWSSLIYAVRISK